MNLKTNMTTELKSLKHLVKTLRSPVNTLQRQRIKEIIKETETTQKLTQYANIEDAREDYGYAAITQAEFEKIQEYFEKGELRLEETPLKYALDELTDYINSLKQQIKNLEWELLPESERERINTAHDKWVEEHGITEKIEKRKRVNINNIFS